MHTCTGKAVESFWMVFFYRGFALMMITSTSESDHSAVESLVKPFYSQRYQRYACTFWLYKWHFAPAIQNVSKLNIKYLTTCNITQHVCPMQDTHSLNRSTNRTMCAHFSHRLYKVGFKCEIYLLLTTYSKIVVLFQAGPLPHVE